MATITFPDGSEFDADQFSEAAQRLASGMFNDASRRVLRELVEYIETEQRAADERKENIKAAFGIAKARGFNVRALKDVIKHRKKDLGPDERDEQRSFFDQYWAALEVD